MNLAVLDFIPLLSQVYEIVQSIVPELLLRHFTHWGWLSIFEEKFVFVVVIRAVYRLMLYPRLLGGVPQVYLLLLHRIQVADLVIVQRSDIDLLLHDES